MNKKSISDKQADILIIDDTPENLDMLIEILKNNNYIVRPVTNGKIALKAMQNKPPDLILLDIYMPDMNGFEVCEQLKKDEKLKDIPVIFISGLTENIDKKKAYSAGGADYIIKPFLYEEIIARVETQLKIRFLEAELEEYKNK